MLTESTVVIADEVVDTIESTGHKARYADAIRDIQNYPEDSSFKKWMDAIQEENVFTSSNLAHICSDEGIRMELFNKASKFTALTTAGFTSTIDSSNRARDAESVADTLGISEKGKPNVKFMSLSKKETHVATGYNRVVYGDHGPYVEFSEDQIMFKNFPKFRTKSEHAFYGERYTIDEEVKLYEQKKSVRGVQNPPKGKLSVKNNRAEGYADYKPGMYYISTGQLKSEEIDLSANIARVLSAKARSSIVRRTRAYQRRGKKFKKKNRTTEEFYETAIAESTTWWVQDDYQVEEVKVKSYPQLPAIEWTPPTSTTMNVTHGPRATSLNGSLLTDRWSSIKLKEVAQIIDQVAEKLFGRDEKGGFQNSKLPHKQKRSALNRRNYIDAILKRVAIIRSRAYKKFREAKTEIKLKEAKDRFTITKNMAMVTDEMASGEEYWSNWKRYVHKNQLLSECQICNKANEELPWMQRLLQVCKDETCCKPQKHVSIVPRTFLTQQITRIYCHAIYERTKEAQEKFYEEGKALKERKEGLWMLSTNDKIIRIVEPSALPQIGGLTKLGNAELMSMKYVLRQSSRRYGTRYQDAANVSVDWHQKVGMPQKGKNEIRNALDRIFSVISDEAVKKQMLLRPEDAVEPADQDDEVSPIINPAFPCLLDESWKDDYDLYYQLPMTWMTWISNSEPGEKTPFRQCQNAKKRRRYKKAG